jgi:hypothetical protein
MFTFLTSRENRKYIYTFVAFFFAIIFVLPAIVHCADPASTKYGLDVTAGASGLLEKSPKDVPTIVGNVLGTVLSMISVVFFALMIYGGFTWMVSRGSSEEATKALNTVFAAIIGIIIVMAAYAITTFVFKSVGNESSATTPNTAVATTAYPASCNTDTKKADYDLCMRPDSGFATSTCESSACQ